MTRRGNLTFCLLAALGALYVGCTQDFNQFEPTGATFPPSSSSSTGGQGGSTGCTDDTECNDLNVCTKDTCNSDSAKCVSAAVADGPAPGIEDIPSDCIDRVCQAGVEKEADDNTETPVDDGNPCKTVVCFGGGVVSGNEPADTDCGNDLVCDGAGTCVGCTKDFQCPEAPECQDRECNAGMCGFSNETMGDPCSAGFCDGNGKCVECLDNNDCNDSTGEICGGQQTCVVSCPDGMKNGSETGMDCGGGICPDCPDGGGCGGGDDCLSGVCKGGTCQPPACDDAVKNGTESDEDCGGATCPKCDDGSDCGAAADCMSNQCAGNVCISCMDMTKNGTESDEDCGGATCPKCGDGSDCGAAADCMSGVCSGGKCFPMTCGDTMTNGTETDVDCGGPTCPDCANGKKCLVGSDCVSTKCQGPAGNKTCQP